jgi:uncharacterized protein (TIGR02099 family)
MIHHLTRATRHLIFWSLIVLGLGSAGIRLALMAVEHYKIELAQKISEMSGLTVQVGSLKGGTRGFDPEIILREITFLTPDKPRQPAIHLKEVRVGVDIWQLLQKRDWLAATWVALIGTKITIIRDHSGKISIKGLGAGDEDIPAWMLHFRQYEILNSEVIWQDGNNTPLTFQQVDCLLRKKNQQSYELHLLTVMPEPFAGKIRLSSELQGNIFQGQLETGRLYLKARQVAIPPALTKLDELAIAAEPADFQFWLDWRNNRLETVAGQWQGQQIQVTTARQQQSVNNLSTLFAWQNKGQGWRLDIVDLNLEAHDKPWQVKLFSLAWDQQRMAAMMDSLDLDLFNIILPWLPDKLKSEHLLEKWHLAGRLQKFTVFRGIDKQNYALSGQFSQLALKAGRQIPSFAGLTGTVQGDSTAGSLWLDSIDGWVHFPGLFRKPLDFKQLQGPLSWSQNQQQWQFNTEALSIATEVLKMHSKFVFELPKSDESAKIDMHLAFNSFQRVNNISRYLPTGIMQPELVKWLDEAKISGNISQGKMRLVGNLEQFPFKQGEGKFEVLAELDNAELQYSPLWPKLTQLDAQLHFLANRLDVDVDNAVSHNIHSHHARVSLPDLANGETVLVKAELFGNVEHFLRFLQRTPLHGTVDNVVDVMTVDGQAKVAFNLSVPLVEMRGFHVAGHFQLQQAAMQIKTLNLPIEKINGIVNFTEQGLFSNQLHGQLAGHALQASISSDPQKVMISSRGEMRTGVLYRLFPKLKNDQAVGRFNYQVKVILPHQQTQPPEVIVETNLKGVQIDLPKPLQKIRQQKRKLSVRVKLKTQHQQLLYFDYGGRLKGALMIGGEQSRLQSAHIVWGEGKANILHGSGVWVEVRLPQLQIDDWLPLLTTHSDNKNPPISVVRLIDVQIGQLKWQSHNLGRIKMQIKPGKQFWQIDLNCPLAQGELLVATRPDVDKSTLHLDVLNLDNLLALKFKPGAERPIELAKLPLFDIYAEKLIFNGVDQGMLIIETQRQQGSVHFKKISLVDDTSSVEMTGEWLKNAMGMQTRLQGHINSQDFSAFLDQLGFANDLRETSAKVQFSLAWAGAPYQFELKKLEGELQLNLTGGRIASIEPGFGRLLGLIAIQQWVKRFSLDFSDIYKKGLAYNTIKGRFEIERGIARSHDLLIDAIAARIKVAGLVNLENKTLDAHVWVVPKSSAAVPIAGTIVGGIASALTRVFDDDYKEGYFFGSEYKVTGHWSDAKVTPLHENNGVIRKIWQGLTVSPQVQ